MRKRQNKPFEINSNGRDNEKSREGREDNKG